MPQLNQESAAPLYFQLAQQLRTRLRGGHFKPGEQLPSERELMTTYRVSRNTVRQAIDTLTHEGLLERVQGKGTFACNPRLKLGLMRLTSFTEDMRERHLDPASRLLHRAVIQPPQQVAGLLHLLPGEETIYIERLRIADQIPMSINLSYFSTARCPGLMSDDLETQSIYDLLEKKYSLQIARAEQLVRAAAATPQESERLEVKHGAPLLIIEGVTFLNDGSPIEYMRSIYRADRYEFSITPVRA